MKEVVVDIGDQVVDPVTGFKGTVVALTTWMFGCRRITVQPKGVDREGKIFDSCAFDEPGLKITKHANVPATVKKKRLNKGGPRPNVGQRQVIER